MLTKKSVLRFKAENLIHLLIGLFCFAIFVVFIIFDVENFRMLNYNFLIFISGIITIYYVSVKRWKLLGVYLLITLFLFCFQAFNIAISYDAWASRGFPPKWEFFMCCDEGFL